MHLHYPKTNSFYFRLLEKRDHIFPKTPTQANKNKRATLQTLKKKKKIVEISVGVDVAWPGLGDRAMVTPAKKQKRHAAAALVLSLLYSQKKKKKNNSESSPKKEIRKGKAKLPTSRELCEKFSEITMKEMYMQTLKMMTNGHCY